MNNKDKDRSLSLDWQIDAICEAFESVWKAGERPTIEDYLQRIDATGQAALLQELIGLDIDYRRKIGEPVEFGDYSSRFPILSVEQFRAWLDRTMSAQLDTRSLDTSAQLPDAPLSSRFIKYFGDYELLEEWARGGMGTVYRARQTSLNRIVAVKTINSGLMAVSDEVLRFTKEAKAAGGLRHRNIVPVYEIGQHDGVHFYSMAFVEGCSLGDKLSHGPLDQHEAAELLSTVASAIHYAHEQGIIHRDIKPSNILLEANGEPLVSDFGLAKQVSENSVLTVSGEVLGTPCYMPPEQASGQMDRVLIQSDVYSLGAVLYTCLSGRPPFQAATKLLTLQQVIDNEPVQLRQLNSALSRDLETIVHKCLDKSVSRRYASALEFKLDLDRFLHGEPIKARPVGMLERTWRWCRRHPARTLNVLGALAVLVGSVIAWYAFERNQAHRQKVVAAESLWNELRVCASSQLPSVLERIQSPSSIEDLLRERVALGYSQARGDTELRFRAGLAMLPYDESVVSDICDGWIYSDWPEWNWVNGQLEGCDEQLRQWLRRLDINKTSQLPERQLTRLSAILSSVSHPPETVEILPQLRAVLPNDQTLVDLLVAELQSDLGAVSHMATAFKKQKLRLGQILADRIDHRLPNEKGHRPTSARLLAEFFQHDSRELIQFGWSAHSDLLAILFANTQEQENYSRAFQEIIARAPPEPQGVSPGSTPAQPGLAPFGSAEQPGLAPFGSGGTGWNERFELNRKKALGGAYLFALNRGGEPLLEMNSDATARCLMIEWVPKLQRDPTELVQRLRRALDTRIKHVESLQASEKARAMIPNCWLTDSESARLRGLLQILGNYSITALRRSCDDEFWKLLALRLQSDPDPGLRSVCEWCLQMHAPQHLVAAKELAAPKTESWYKVANDHLMVRIGGPVEFMAGSAADDPYRDAGIDRDVILNTTSTWSEDHRHAKKINRSFAMATAETTYAQMQQFHPDFHLRQNRSLAPEIALPANRVTWMDAARYCNWLSQQHGIPEEEYCFVIESAESVRPVERYLHKKGFRLPTEAEWEFACRAGTSSGCFFGDAPELLDNYCWYFRNSQEMSLLSASSRKPNELGLFQTLGNALEWTMDRFSTQHSGHRFREDDIEFSQENWPLMILKGGSIFSLPRDVRAAEFFSFQPTYREGNVGFRIAQTLESFEGSR